MTPGQKLSQALMRAEKEDTRNGEVAVAEWTRALTYAHVALISTLRGFGWLVFIVSVMLVLAVRL